MSDYDSDESLNTEDLNEINNTEFEQVEVKSVERTKQTKVQPIVKKSPKSVPEEPLEPTPTPKPKKPRSEKQIAHAKKLVELNKDRAEKRAKARAEGKIVDEKPLGRKPKPAPPKEEIVVNRQIEKIIYMIPDGQGGFEKHLNKPRITKKDIQYHKNIQEAEQEQLIAGKKLLTTKKGKIDNRSKKQRTPAQIAATEKLVAKAKERREAAKKKALADKQEEVEVIKDQVHNSIVEVVKTPAHLIQKKAERVIASRPAITDEDRQQAQNRRVKHLFS